MTSADIVACISRDLHIPSYLIKCKNESEAIVLVENDWFLQLGESAHGSELKNKDRFLNTQLDTELHHSTFVQNGCMKLFISILKLDEFVESTNKAEESFVTSYICKLQDDLAKEIFTYSWKNSYKKYEDCYIAGKYRDVSNLNGFPQSHTVTKTLPNFKYANCLPLLGKVESLENVYLIKKCILHSVHDALMYSPSLLNSSNAKPLFIFFQLLKILNFVTTQLPTLQIEHLTWRRVEVNELLWMRADLREEEPAHYFSDDENNGKEGRDTLLYKDISPDCLSKVTELWVCRKLSNYDYLMHLNKLAGRRLNDPNHHPILPWISDLSCLNGGWRDLSKSKYRLNKGDDQLGLQYAMAANNSHLTDKDCNAHVPHHVPDMLSDITFYVYKARVIPKEILQKHVRSYWEPNEYPSSIQRMQEWTPDECIPEFYNDPSIFTSMHHDMIDLATPEWCESPEDFISKHMSMLESDAVSEHLNDWIDITFGYKLSGKDAVESLNVCRQLVDQHTKPVTQGIVQLFNSPHPKKWTNKCSSLEDILSQLSVNASSTKQPCVKEHPSTDKQDSGNTVTSSEDLPEVPKSDDASSLENSYVEVRRNISLPEDFKPFSALDQLEKLCTFNAFEMEKFEISQEMKDRVQGLRNDMLDCSAEEVVNDRNLLTFICLAIELFTIPHATSSSFEFPLSQRFKAAALCYQSNRLVFPITVRNAMEYLFGCLAHPLERTCELLKKEEKSTKSSTGWQRYRFFKHSNRHGYPPPRPSHLLSEHMQIIRFPVYFEALHCFLEKLVTLTEYYEVALEEDNYNEIEDDLVNLLAKLYGCHEGLDILMSHVIRLLKQPVQFAASFLVLVFDHVAQELGPEGTCKRLLPAIIALYTKANISSPASFDNTKNNPIEVLSDKCFLFQLRTRLGLNVFLENFPRLIIESLISSSDHQVLDVVSASVEWLLASLGPTLASKCIIRHLLLSLNACHCSDVKEELSFGNTNAQQVIDCLVYAASLYGPVLFTLQYIPHISFSASEHTLIRPPTMFSAVLLFVLCHLSTLTSLAPVLVPGGKNMVSSAISGTCFNDRSFAALDAATTLLISIVPFLTDGALMEQLNRLSKEIIMPLIGVLSSKHIRFPAGGKQRKYLCLKTINLLVSIALRIGREMSRNHLTELLRSFFSNFHSHNSELTIGSSDIADESFLLEESEIQFDDLVPLPSSLDPGSDSITAAVQLGLLNNSFDKSSDVVNNDDTAKNSQSARSKRSNSGRRLAVFDVQTKREIAEELRQAFSSETACAYLPFAQLMGDIHMKKVLNDHADVVWNLISPYSEPSSESPPKVFNQIKQPKGKAGISYVGNRIVVEENDEASNSAVISADSTQQKELPGKLTVKVGGIELKTFESKLVQVFYPRSGTVCRLYFSGDDSTHLADLWFAYWEHEIGLPPDDNHIHFNQIDLQSFQGHSAAVRSMYVSDSEEWFMSGSKDKTVKIWSLSSGNNGSSPPLFVYRHHKKTVFFNNLVEAYNRVVSCDGSIHTWDPFTGQQISSLDGNEFKANILALSLLPAPQRELLAVTSDTLIRMIDLRTNCVAQEYKTVIGASVGVVRSVCSNSTQAAVGFSSGVLSLLDLRMGPILRMWQAHDSDIVSSTYVTSSTFVTAAMDQTIAYWKSGVLEPYMVYRSLPENVHLIKTFHNEVVSASNSNRILVHTLPIKNANGDISVTKAELDQPTLSTKLRTDIFRGSLTTFSILPMKRQLLVASDTGAIRLLA